jgi:ferredoxin
VKVHIDRDRCTGHGRCYTLAPSIFAPDDEGYGEVVVADVEAEGEGHARLAEQSCPEGAITVE